MRDERKVGVGWKEEDKEWKELGAGWQEGGERWKEGGHGEETKEMRHERNEGEGWKEKYEGWKEEGSGLKKKEVRNDRVEKGKQGRNEKEERKWAKKLLNYLGNATQDLLQINDERTVK